MPDREPPPFEQHCRSALAGLRTALAELYETCGARADVPQDVARRFGIHRTPSWKASRIIRAKDALTLCQHLPGASGLLILVEAFREAGAPEAVANAVLAASDEFESMLATHAGERGTLEWMLDGLAPAELLDEVTGHLDDGGDGRLAFTRKGVGKRCCPLDVHGSIGRYEHVHGWSSRLVLLQG